MMQTENAPTCPFIVLKPPIIARDRKELSRHVINPINEDPDPRRPQRIAFPHMSLELSIDKHIPVLRMASHSTTCRLLPHNRLRLEGRAPECSRNWQVGC